MEAHHNLCSRPLKFIKERCKDELLAKNGGAECVKAVIEAFRAALAQPDMIRSIPLLTPELWKSDRLGVNTLVRFRGMVQVGKGYPPSRLYIPHYAAVSPLSLIE